MFLYFFIIRTKENEIISYTIMLKINALLSCKSNN
jgi:hypothetical protein